MFAYGWLLFICLKDAFNSVSGQQMSQATRKCGNNNLKKNKRCHPFAFFILYKKTAAALYENNKSNQKCSSSSYKNNNSAVKINKTGAHYSAVVCERGAQALRGCGAGCQQAHCGCCRTAWPTEVSAKKSKQQQQPQPLANETQ